MYEERNRKIKESGKATRERRASMDCRTFSVKIQENRVSNAKREKLERCFLEAKWLYNAILATETLALEDTSSVQVKVKDSFEVRPINTLSAQMKQSIADDVKTTDRDIHSANMMVLLSGYGTYRSLNTDTVSTERMIGFLDSLSNLSVVVSTTNSMEACYL